MPMTRTDYYWRLLKAAAEEVSKHTFDLINNAGKIPEEHAERGLSDF